MSMRFNGIRHIVVVTVLGFGFGAHSATEKADTATGAETSPVGKGVTAQDQAQGTSGDVEVTRKIREQLVKDKQLSTSAQNVQIVTLGNMVTVKGTVKSTAEKQKIADVVGKVAGNRQVDNQVEVRAQ